MEAKRMERGTRKKNLGKPTESMPVDPHERFLRRFALFLRTSVLPETDLRHLDRSTRLYILDLLRRHLSHHAQDQEEEQRRGQEEE